MKRFSACIVVAATLLFAIPRAQAAQCDDRTATSEQVAACLGQELRDSDTKINDSYRALMGKLGDTEKGKLRTEQRAWIKERDQVCRLDDRQSDREKWYAALLSDYRKTVCVTRYTRERTAELDHMLTAPLPVTDAASVAAGPPLPAVSHQPYDYEAVFPQKNMKGLWYFEVTLDIGAIARFSPTAMDITCEDLAAAPTGAASLIQIRGADTSLPVLRKGVALDLENGKFYVRTDGVWLKGAPGSSNGLDLKLGRLYKCGIDSTVLVAPLIQKGYLDINLGQKPFTYAIPDGYRPFSESGN